MVLSTMVCMRARTFSSSLEINMAHPIARITMLYISDDVYLDISHLAKYFFARDFSCRSSAGVRGKNAASIFNSLTKSISVSIDFSNFFRTHFESVNGVIILGCAAPVMNNGFDSSSFIGNRLQSCFCLTPLK